jgi:hypothetical protein
MNIVLIFVWIWGAMVALSFVESYAEGRNAWEKGKKGWKFKIYGYYITGYHFYLFWVMLPVLVTLPLMIYGWDLKLFGIILSAYFSGMVLEDIMWYVVNPVVKFKELFTQFSDYYPWIKFNNQKIIPDIYVVGIILSIISWCLFWS